MNIAPGPLEKRYPANLIYSESPFSATTAELLLKFVEGQKEDMCPNYTKMVSYTTRPPRPGEEDGIDYHFVSDEKFKEMEKRGEFAETGAYRGWCYGSAKVDYQHNALAVLTPHGMRQVKKTFSGSSEYDIKVVYLDVPRRDRLIKILQRGDDIEEAYRRSLSDLGQFDGIRDEANIIVKNPGFTKSAQDVAAEIYEKLNFQEEQKCS